MKTRLTRKNARTQSALILRKITWWRSSNRKCTYGHPIPVTNWNPCNKSFGYQPIGVWSSGHSGIAGGQSNRHGRSINWSVNCECGVHSSYPYFPRSRLSWLPRFCWMIKTVNNLCCSSSASFMFYNIFLSPFLISVEVSSFYFSLFHVSSFQF